MTQCLTSLQQILRSEQTDLENLRTQQSKLLTSKGPDEEYKEIGRQISILEKTILEHDLSYQNYLHLYDRVKNDFAQETAYRERQRKEQLVKNLKEDPPACLKCRSRDVIIRGQPIFPSPSGWGIKGVVWRIPFKCKNCSLLFDIEPDNPTKQIYADVIPASR